MDNHYKMILQRNDNLISSVNAKGGLIVVFNTFLCGSIISKYADLRPFFDKSDFSNIIDLSLIAIFLLSIISVFLVGLAVFPFLESGNSSTSKYHSHIFFNSISEFKCDNDFLDSCKSYEKAEALEDLKRQIYILSKGLKKKFKFIGWAMLLFFGNLILLLTMTILIIK